MTLRDLGVQIGFLMVTAGAMLAAWAILTGQFRRGGAEPDEAEPVEPDHVKRAPRPRPKPAASGTPPRKASVRKPAARKASAAKRKPPARRKPSNGKPAPPA